MTDPTDRRTSFGLYPENFQLHSTDVGHTSPFNQDGTPMPRENDRPVITEEVSPFFFSNFFFLNLSYLFQ